MVLIIVIGPPAAGKTFLCQEFCFQNPSLRHIEMDSMVALDDNNKVYKQKRHEAYKIIIDGISKNPIQDVIIDDTFHFFSMRKPFLRLAADLRIGFGIVRMSLPLDILVERNGKRESQIGFETLVSIYNKFEELRPEEFIHLITTPNSPLIIPARFRQNSVREIQNNVHNLNIAKNKLVHETISNLKFKDKRVIQSIIQLKNECSCLQDLQKDLQIYLNSINRDLDVDPYLPCLRSKPNELGY